MAYDAFISYSHAADGRLAPALQSALQRFAKPWWKLRALNLFRDATSLAASHDLTGAIKAALGEARHFVLLASPRAAASKWVQREIEFWRQSRAADTILIVLTDGAIAWDEAAGDFDWTRTDALPASLEGAFGSEPLWIDLAWARREDQVSARDPRFQHAIAMLAARLHGKSLDAIAGEDVRQHLRTRRLARAAQAAIALFAAAATAGAWYGISGQRQAEVEAARARAAAAAEARQRVEADRQRTAAQDNLAEALRAADTIVFGLVRNAGRFAGVPKQTLLQLVKQVEAVLTRLERGNDSPELRHRQVNVQLELSNLYLYLGELETALARARRARAILETMRAAAPADNPMRRSLADALVAEAKVLLRLARVDQAHEQLQRARALLEAVTGPEAETDAHLEALMVVLAQIARIHVRTKNPDQGLAVLDQARRIGRILYLERGRSDLAESYSELLAIAGPLLRQKGDHAELARVVDEREQIIDRELARNPGDADWMRARRAHYSQRASALAARGEHAAASEMYAKALGVAHRLTGLDPSSVQDAVVLMRTHLIWADHEARRNELAKALQQYGLATSAAKRALALNPNHREVKLSLAYAEQRYREVEEKLADAAKPSTKSR
jgi:tetratricopeptide (TPR) repeat protein